jgi:hypothetical protein
LRPNTEGACDGDEGEKDSGEKDGGAAAAAGVRQGKGKRKGGAKAKTDARTERIVVAPGTPEPATLLPTGVARAPPSGSVDDNRAVPCTILVDPAALARAAVATGIQFAVRC